MEKSRKTLKTVTISEVEFEFSHREGLVTLFVVDVKVPQEDDQTVGEFETLAEAEEYASDVAKRPLKPWDMNSAILGER